MALRSRLVSGYAFASRSNSVATAAFASPTVAPGRSRPRASTQNALRLAAQCSGRHRKCCTSGTEIRRGLPDVMPERLGATPITVGVRSSV
jgi:hypothetical protein